MSIKGVQNKKGFQNQGLGLTLSYLNPETFRTGRMRLMVRSRSQDEGQGDSMHDPFQNQVEPDNQ